MDLEAENQHLRGTLFELRSENVALRARAEAAEARVAAAEEAAVRLQRELDLLRRQIVGPTSERVVDPNQLSLPIAGEPPAATETVESTPPSSERDKDRQRTRRGRTSPGRRNVAEMNHLRTVVFEKRVEARACPCGCGAQAQTIGHDVSWRLERIPAEIVRHKIVQEKVAFPEHTGSGQATIVTAPSPMSYALPKALCGNELLAQIIIDKYADHRVPRRHAQQPKGRRSKPCCMDDEGSPLGIGVQVQVPNHLELLGSRVRVVSVEGNGAARLRQVRSKKTSESEPLMTCREVSTRRRNRTGWLFRDEPRESLPIGWAASGMKAA